MQISASSLSVRADVAVAHGDRGQRGRWRRSPRPLARCARMAGARARDRAEELVVEAQLDGDRLLFRADDLLFELLEIGRDVALGVGERLLADVVRRHLGEVRFRDLDVVAEDGVEADLERGDAGALALARLDLEQDRLRVAGDGAQLVELGVDAVGDDAAVADGCIGGLGSMRLRRSRRDRPSLAAGASCRSRAHRTRSERTLRAGCHARSPRSSSAIKQRIGQREALARRGGAQRDARGDALEVGDLLQARGHLLEDRARAGQLVDGVVAVEDRLARFERARQPAAQRARAHRRARRVDDAPERGARAAGVARFEDLRGSPASPRRAAESRRRCRRAATRT